MASSIDSLEFNDVEFNETRLNSIKTHLEESQGIRNQALNELKRLLTGSSGLVPCLDDNFLLRFLRRARYRPDITLKRLKTYYFCKNTHPEIFQNYVPSNTLSVQALHHIKALPYRAKNLSAVVVIKLGQVDLQQVSYIELLRLELMVFETLMQNPVTQLTGITVIIDCDGFSQDQMAKVVDILPTFYDVFHHDCTMGIGHVHVIRPPALLCLLYGNILPTWPKKKHTQLVFYPSGTPLDELHNQVSLDYLPEEFGGKLPSSSLVDLNPIVNEQESYFREQLQYGVTNDGIELD